MKKIFALFAFWTVWHCATAQNNSLYMPLDIQNLYQKGFTRQMKGSPPETYWQNRAEYQIKAELDPNTRLLKGTEKITYYNNSPDVISQMVFRIYQDLYKKGVVRYRSVNTNDIHDGVEVGTIKVNGEELPENSVSRQNTNMSIVLPTKLKSKDKVTIELSWSFVFPKETNLREGYYGNGSFFVAYWYPQIAVYDDLDGWDELPYTGEQEFYNDFNNYEVEISVPEKQVVWATGLLQNGNEVFEKPVLERIQKAQTSDQVVKIIEKADLEKGNITQKKGKNTWKFKAENVPDFAFATSPNYLWDATSVEVDKKTKRRTLVGAAYNPNSADFYNVAEIGRKTVDFLSHEMPAVAFPYPHVTVFNGSGGMEFPMMVNDGSFWQADETNYVTSHEIAHTYFPFLMGINEKKYSWMDEGMAQFIPYEFQDRTQTNFKPKSWEAAYFSKQAGQQMELPLMIPTYFHSNNTYQISSYIRPANAYSNLEDALGKDLFKKALQEYIALWRGKHPLPYDFFYTFEAVAGENLSWFWKPWFFESGYPDLGIGEVKIEGKKCTVTVKKVGNCPVPIYLTLVSKTGTQKKQYESCRIWKDKNEVQFSFELDAPLKSIVLGADDVADAISENNFYEVKE